MIVGICALAALIGLFVVMAMRAKARNKAALAWPSVEGEIIHSEATGKWSTDSQGQAVMRYKADIRFRYTVDGKSYDGTRIAFYGAIVDTAAKAQAQCNHYPVGAKMPVYYDPRKPADSVLERREGKTG